MKQECQHKPINTSQDGFYETYCPLCDNILSTDEGVDVMEDYERLIKMRRE